MYWQVTAFVLAITILVDLKPVEHFKDRLPEDDMLLYWREPPGQNCTPFTAFRRQCNKCVCAADGSLSCTRFECELVQDWNLAASDRKSFVEIAATLNQKEYPNNDPNNDAIEDDYPAPGPIAAAVPNDTNVADENHQELDDDILKILATDPNDTNIYGKNIQKDLANHLERSTSEGLSKDSREQLTSLYLIPNNCKLIGTPVLNPELKEALSAQNIKRDEVIESKQKVLSAAMSSLGQAITHVLDAKDIDNNLLSFLMDTARLVGDCHHTDTITRRYYIINSIPEAKKYLQNAKSDTFLFGQNLLDTSKDAKVNKSGADLKSTPAPRTSNSTSNLPKKWRSIAPQATASKQTTTMAPKETAMTALKQMATTTAPKEKAITALEEMAMMAPREKAMTAPKEMAMTAPEETAMTALKVVAMTASKEMALTVMTAPTAATKLPHADTRPSQSQRTIRIYL